MYKSQYQFDGHYDQEKDRKLDREMIVSGKEMNIEMLSQVEVERLNREMNKKTGGVMMYNKAGQMPKAMPHHLKGFNAGQYYRNYQDRLSKNVENSKIRFGLVEPKKENFDSNVPKPEKKARPSTAKTMKGGKPR
mmetsp:Transcript_33044/g.32174  ORF Transcript_33044/g.32174 Transcript_33044/m.32174 type:complete len:135 (-) Transcript_33044:14-418(-)|eukprot:CAMPEP_0170564184 /NCGR_PEP_ID=MMETSP0211-20121228/71465_1 /TAXON_ID=311385 /ORGANISM="Pseudokeronopsis sp., Strain OXSARD2" /LENGTH=134 /DNA_ID=CAMNT_0010883343 /DNA_START=395 /DNA_END=799 /DNA_ORIENTATION=+